MKATDYRRVMTRLRKHVDKRNWPFIDFALSRDEPAEATGLRLNVISAMTWILAGGSASDEGLKTWLEACNTAYSLASETLAGAIKEVSK
jgi:hypothetical protein